MATDNGEILLNLNLIIPFKDKRGQKLLLYKSELERFKSSLEVRSGEMNEELVDLFGDKFELTIAARSDGNSKKYFWRFKSSKFDRKYNRLYSEPVICYIEKYDSNRKLRLKEMEQELIYINANSKLIKGMLDSIDQSKEEQNHLRDIVFQN